MNCNFDTFFEVEFDKFLRAPRRPDIRNNKCCVFPDTLVLLDEPQPDHCQMRLRVISKLAGLPADLCCPKILQHMACSFGRGCLWHGSPILGRDLNVISMRYNKKLTSTFSKLFPCPIIGPNWQAPVFVAWLNNPGTWLECQLWAIIIINWPVLSPDYFPVQLLKQIDKHRRSNSLWAQN